MMILGTGSHCGKTTVVAGLCRYFADRGLRVAPFKSQNMALNSYVTEAGHEIARSIAVQAQGARQTPTVAMNPILLKPKSDTVCQLIINGRAVCDVTAETNFLDPTLRAEKLAAIDEAIGRLQTDFDLIVAEGAGSCAEPNLASVDLVNLTIAKRLGARVFVLGDIDAGGVFAQFAGTHAILERTDPAGLKLLEGFVINKFRGDPKLLAEGLNDHQANCPVPIDGVLPMLHDLQLDEEDRPTFPARPAAPLKIVIPYLPRIANTTDFDRLARADDVEVRLVSNARDIGQPAAIILPGTKNTVEDLDALRTSGMADRICELAATTPVCGVCGGFQMLGRALHDPDHVESTRDTVEGLGLLDIEIRFAPRKTVARHTYRATSHNPFDLTEPIHGYEIHCGDVIGSTARPMFVAESPEAADEGGWAHMDGDVHPSQPIFGSFIHDLFRDGAFCLAFLNLLRDRHGLPRRSAPPTDSREVADASLNRVAAMLRDHWVPELEVSSS